ncbi:unnamed protein product, partial [Gongylonema pulchrum]|uniref:C3H1-type domain-containing protein n=1 Tax=Gongylonema pulchrum TaxID=637853 RepID=A0A183DG61_9BILA
MFYQSGTCSYGARCRFAHGDEPTAGTQGYNEDRGRGFRRGGPPPFRGGQRRGAMDGGYRSRSRSRSESPFGRRNYSPDRRRYGSPRSLRGRDREERIERRQRTDDRGRDQHSGGGTDTVRDLKQQTQEHPGEEAQKLKKVESEKDTKAKGTKVNTEQQKSP